MCLFITDRTVICRNGQTKVVTTKCGKCVECLKERQNSWKLRLCKESDNWSHIFFFTLTYSDDNLPCNLVFNDEVDNVLYSGTFSQCCDYYNKHYKPLNFSVCDLATQKLNANDRETLLYNSDMSIKSTVNFIDVQNYIKRIRSSYRYDYGTNLDCKYFVCSEYGSNPNATRRPHYHGILFTNACYDDLAPLFDTWSVDFGRMEFKEINSLSREQKSSVANYVSKYCAKGEFNSRLDDISFGHCSSARFSCSNGLGIKFCDEVLKPELYSKIPLSLEVEMATSDIFIDQDMVASYFAIADIDATVPFHCINPLTYQPVVVDTDFVNKVRSVRDEIYNLLPYLKVFDGSFGYKIPRPFYDRLFLRKHSEERVVSTDDCSLRLSLDAFSDRDPYYFITNINNLPFIDYETKAYKITRYVQENFLSNAITYCLREQHYDRLSRLTQEQRDRLSKISSTFFETLGRYLSVDELSKFHRLQDAQAKLHNFYFTNSIKHSNLE